MKEMLEKEALEQLAKIKTSYQNFIRENFEFKAKNCLTCETKGACCLDAHFVNVHITRLEAVAITEVLAKFSAEKQAEIFQRIEETIEKYKLTDEAETFTQTFACPLFEPQIGCLIHGAAKPTPCIQHACYEREEDLPPQGLQDFAEQKIEKLNAEIYGENWRWLPLPVWLKIINSAD